MNFIKIRNYALYSLVLFGTLHSIWIFQQKLLTIDPSFYTNYITYISLYGYISIGIILGLPHLLNEFKKSGIWKINIPKLLFIGAPAILFTGFNPIIGLWHPQIAHSISGLILGYIIVTSFYKTDR